MQKSVAHFSGAALSFLLLAPAAFAQNTVGEISGYVRDTSGGVLQGATVTAIFKDIAVSRTAIADSRGFYLLANVPNGEAYVIAELQGFQKAQRSAVRASPWKPPSSGPR